MLNQQGLIGVLRVWGAVILFFGVAFICAGTTNWPAGWMSFEIVVFGLVIISTALIRQRSGLLNRRATMGTGTAGWDLYWIRIYQPMPIAVFAVAGLDLRFGWSSPLTWPLWIGFTLFSLSFVIVLSSMLENNHFEGSVRIQHEIGHTIITSGPYAWVRHPGYTGFILGYFAVPLMLGSLWALIPSGVAIVWLILRTGLEDLTLHSQLPQYPKYTQKVRFKLFPGLW